MKYILNNSVMIHESPTDGIMVSVTGSPIININEKEEEVLKIFSEFTRPMSYEEAYSRICSKVFVSEDDYQECFEFMRTNNLLKVVSESKEVLTSYQLEKYNRQISSFASLPGIEMSDAKVMQKKICNSHVCIIGVGGTGSHLALALASIGVEHMTLVDFDMIELSNTARQILYDETDIGKLKLDVAKEKLEKYNSNLKVDTYNIEIKNAEDLSFLQNKQIDLLILCADTPRGKIQFIVDEMAVNYNIPWFCYGPYNHSQIVIGPLFIPGEGQTYSDIYPDDIISANNRKDEISEINRHFVASICDPYNGFASQFAAIETFKYLSGIRKPSIINRRYYIDTDTWEKEYIDYD